MAFAAAAPICVFYDTDPDASIDRAVAAGYEILKFPADRLHGLHEAYIIGPYNYI